MSQGDVNENCNSYLNNSTGTDENVLRLHVAMNNAMGMQIVEGSNLTGQPHSIPSFSDAAYIHQECTEWAPNGKYILGNISMLELLKPGDRTPITSCLAIAWT